MALVSLRVCPIVPAAAGLFSQSLWYPLKHVAASCWGIERGDVKKSVWEHVREAKASIKENVQWVKRNEKDRET